MSHADILDDEPEPARVHTGDGYPAHPREGDGWQYTRGGGVWFYRRRGTVWHLEWDSVRTYEARENENDR